MHNLIYLISMIFLGYMIVPMILEIHFDSYYFNHSCMVKNMLVLFKKI